MSSSPVRLSSPTYRPDIDGLRAVAVIPVVLFHAFPDCLRGGFIGVDIFFVISGFLISTILFENLTRGTFSFTEFYARRIKRIFPALLLVLLFCCLIGWFVLLADEYKRLGRHVAAGAGFVSNFVLWKEAGYFDTSAETKPLLHLWSLAIEEQFYIIWPLLLRLFWKRKKSVVALTAVVVAVSFTANMLGIYRDMSFAFFSPITRFWELLAGGVLAWYTLFVKQSPAGGQTALYPTEVSGSAAVSMRPDSRVVAHWLSLLGFALLVYGFTSIHKDDNFPGLLAVIPVAGAVLLIAAGPGAWVNRTILANPLAVWVGLISFPLYLWHWPLLSFARVIEGEIPRLSTRLTMVVLAVVLSWLTYRFVEQRVRFGRPAAGKTPALVVLMVLFGCIGISTAQNSGWPFRSINILNKEIGQVQQYNWNKDYRRGTCFLDATLETSDAYADVCTSVSTPGRPVVMLWGDSHAAALYKGLAVQAERLAFNLSQLTASGCPPIFDCTVTNSQHCTELNAYARQKIQEVRPDILIMAGYWSLYDGTDKWDQLDMGMLAQTLAVVKEIGIEKIIVVGHLPTYTVNQTDMLRKRFQGDTVNTRTYRHFKKTAIDVNADIARIARQEGVQFINPLDFLCNSQGCMLSLANDAIVPLAFDYGHLTPEGSTYLVAQFFKDNLIGLADVVRGEATDR
ncbi:acyltransferase family protein [Desulfobulbus oligotrophicus]|uniref:Acyltransferase n=1 Tax=Desulfobulbus oligotrophicus TaxID=1909699 RepID=A0A7T5VAX8_9BACT|nr:acyltransferase family protein [Desulfobulbus oligotrophicus]QQG64542.1 acyltransferase [Desulfobulbus oligotrophicus]